MNKAMGYAVFGVVAAVGAVAVFSIVGDLIGAVIMGMAQGIAG